MMAIGNAPKNASVRQGAMRLLPLAALLALGIIPGALAEEAAPAEPPAALNAIGSEDEIQQFCTNIADAARDRRYVLQKNELAKLQKDVDARIAILEKRKMEYEDWLKRRNDFLKVAEANLVDIFKTMKPDAAAPQLNEMNVEVAAAIIMKLPAKQSGAIMSEMDAAKAAKVAVIMASAVDPNTSKDPT